MGTSWNSQVAKGDYRIQFETDDYEKYKIVEKACCAVIDCGTDTDDKLKEHPFALQMVLKKIEFEIEEYIRMLSVLNASESVQGQSIAAERILREIRKTRYEWTKGEKNEQKRRSEGRI